MMTVYSLTGCHDAGDYSSCVLLPANSTNNQNLHHALCVCVTLSGTEMKPLNCISPFYTCTIMVHCAANVDGIGICQ